MATASDIPGYVQGYRLANDPAFYDSSEKRFLDQAGYGSRADLRITVGTPTFETIDSNESMKLDNTCHGEFPMPIAWMGSCIFVVKPKYVSGAILSRWPLLFGDLATATSNGGLRLQHASGNRRFDLLTPSGQLTLRVTAGTDALAVVAYSFDQSNRTAYGTFDGTTITDAAGPASSTNGNAIAFTAAQNGVRFGNMSGTAGDTTEITDWLCNIYEMHFFNGNILTDALTETKAFMDELKTAYGV